MVALNANTTDTYKLSNIKDDMFGRKFDLSNVNIKLIDNDSDKVADELTMDYKLNGKSDHANLKFISEGEGNYHPHYMFQYECQLTYDENVEFESNQMIYF